MLTQEGADTTAQSAIACKADSVSVQPPLTVSGPTQLLQLHESPAIQHPMPQRTTCTLNHIHICCLL